MENDATLTFGHDESEFWDHSGSRWVQEGPIGERTSAAKVMGVYGAAQTALEACRLITSR